MSQIEKLGKQRYRITIWLPRSPDGSRNYERENFHGTLEKAKDRAREMEEEAKSSAVPRSQSSTLNEYLGQWLKLAVKPRVAPRTYNDYRDLLERYIQPELGQAKLATIQPLQIQLAYSKLQDKGLSPRTIRYTHTVLKNALKQAVIWRLLKHNPAEGAQLPRADRRTINPLNEEQARRFILAAQQTDYYALFLLAITTGLRPEEYLALEWSSIDFEASTVKVSRALIWERPGKSWGFGDPKTKKGERTVPMPSQTRQALREHQREQVKARLKSGKWPDMNLVFCTSRGGPIDPGNLAARQFKPLLTAAGLSDELNLYALRHTWVTLSLAAGVPPKTVSEWAGHTSVAFTLDTYSHLIPSMERQGAAQIQALFTSIMRKEKSAGTPAGKLFKQDPPVND